MYKYSCYTDTDTHDIIISCSWPLIHGYSTPPFHVPVFALSLFWHVLVLTLHGYSRTRGTVFARRYMIYWTVIACTHGHILRIMYCTDIVIISISHCCVDSPACMWWLSLYSCYIDHCSCHMDYCYMRGLIFLLHDCFPSLLYWYSRYWTCELLICDVWNPTSIYFPFPVILFLAINRAHVLLSCYMIMYCTYSWYTL